MTFAPKKRFHNGQRVQNIIGVPVGDPEKRRCRNCGESTRTPLRHFCEPCRTTLTADEKRACYAKV